MEEFHVFGIDVDLSTRKGKDHPFLNIRKLTARVHGFRKNKIYHSEKKGFYYKTGVSI